MSLQAMFELSTAQLDYVAGGLPTTPAAPTGTVAAKFVSNGPNGMDTGWLFTTTFGSVFVSAQPDDNIETALDGIN
jgi:hypothetical protein